METSHVTTYQVIINISQLRIIFCYVSSPKAIVFKQKIILSWAILMMTWYVVTWLVSMLYHIFECHSLSFLTRLSDLDIYIYIYISMHNILLISRPVLSDKNHQKAEIPSA